MSRVVLVALIMFTVISSDVLEALALINFCPQQFHRQNSIHFLYFLWDWVSRVFGGCVWRLFIEWVK